MSWEKSSYTAAGAAMLSESLSGGALVITRAVSGTGTADADLSGETLSLIHISEPTRPY